MEETTKSVDRMEFEYYLPGMPQLTTEAGRVERFLTRLFRQRGSYRVRVSRRER